MRCGRCVRKYGGSCSRRPRNTRLGNGSARFLRSVRSDRPCCWAFCRLRTGFAPSGSSGPTADLASRPRAAPITVVSMGYPTSSSGISNKDETAYRSCGDCVANFTNGEEEEAKLTKVVASWSRMSSCGKALRLRSWQTGSYFPSLTAVSLLDKTQRRPLLRLRLSLNAH